MSTEHHGLRHGLDLGAADASASKIEAVFQPRFWTVVGIFRRRISYWHPHYSLSRSGKASAGGVRNQAQERAAHF